MNLFGGPIKCPGLSRTGFYLSVERRTKSQSQGIKVFYSTVDGLLGSVFGLLIRTEERV